MWTRTFSDTQEDRGREPALKQDPILSTTGCLELSNARISCPSSALWFDESQCLLRDHVYVSVKRRCCGRDNNSHRFQHCLRLDDLPSPL
ncbi:hypothetical protein SprV_0200834000 [Sparganum proliferum]